ncbi:tetratricopeptide repeat protein [Desulfosediminicola flagellatus]|uniref:O-linked N-acetylglucosamine transferase family protein n=1 Tax=Desulfosediminicola flagellatus TaxID=2569541 RepID=UPI0010AB892D|nr:tetratricopeptide repeat protein [Desulfosediminicola flagellatus]
MDKRATNNILQTATNLFNKGKYDQSIALCNKLIKKHPRPIYAIFLLGQSYAAKGNYNKAIHHFDTLIGQDTNNPEYLFQRGKCYYILKNFTKAIEDFTKALVSTPDSFPLRLITGKAFFYSADYAHAKTMFLEAIRINPDNITAYESLARTSEYLNEVQDVLKYYQKAIELDKDNIALLNNFGTFLSQHNNSGIAVNYFKRILEISPGNAFALNNLGQALCNLREIRASCKCFMDALKSDNNFSDAHSNLLLTLHYDTIFTAEDILSKHLQWEKLHTQSINLFQHPKPSDFTKKLRIGYVSSDFFSHSVAYFITPIIQAHDKDNYEIYCFSNVSKQDDFTKKIRSIPQIHWRDIQNLNDFDTADLIYKEQIDILVDLSGHTVPNKLKVFAHKPAPIQISYLGYPDTTGLSTMDYRLTDTWADPIETSDLLYSEKLYRLSKGFLCYQPPDNSSLPSKSPALSNGYITFGSFNNFTKISDGVISIWSNILQQTPNSKLLLKSKDLTGLAEERLLNDFEKYGIQQERIIRKSFVPSMLEHLEIYNQIDIALDTFPYNGTTTTLEALWMGKPVITLTGNTHVTRVGCSILQSLGLPELITYSPEEYVEKCTVLAASPEKIDELTRTLRELMMSSNVLNPAMFTTELETVYRKMWETYCYEINNAAVLESRREVILFSGVFISVPENISNRNTYQLLEHEDILNDEIRYLRSIAQKNSTIIDIGCGYGEFCLTAAKYIGPNGRVLAFDESALKRQHLARSIKINLLENIEISPLNSDTSLSCISLDEGEHPDKHSPLKIIRINISGHLEELLSGASAPIQHQSPLIVLEVQSTLPTPIVIPKILLDHSYSPYRFLPGPEKIIPLSDQDLENFSDSLFLCKRDTATALNSEGFLALQLSDIEIPELHQSKTLSDLYSRYAYAPVFATDWLNAAPLPGWQTYFTSLNLYLMSLIENDITKTCSELKKAYQLLSLTCDTHPSLTRLLTLARMAHDFGMKTHSLNILHGVLDIILENSSLLDLHAEPFLVPHPRFDDVSCGQFEGDWILAAILEQIERIEHPTSYACNRDDLLRLEMIDSSGFGSKFNERKRQLLRLQLGMQKQLTPSITLARPSKDNLNFKLWGEPSTSQYLSTIPIR